MLKKLKQLIQNLKRLNKLEKEYKHIDKALVEFNLDVNKFLEGKDYLAEMTEEDRDEIIRTGASIYNNKSFSLVINHLINIQASHSILQSATSQLTMFDRAGINCLTLLKDEFKKLDAIYKDKIKPEEEYDKHEVI